MIRDQHPLGGAAPGASRSLPRVCRPYRASLRCPRATEPPLAVPTPQSILWVSRPHRASPGCGSPMGHPLGVPAPRGLPRAQPQPGLSLEGSPGWVSSAAELSGPGAAGLGLLWLLLTWAEPQPASRAGQNGNSRRTEPASLLSSRVGSAPRPGDTAGTGLSPRCPGAPEGCPAWAKAAPLPRDPARPGL